MKVKRSTLNNYSSMLEIDEQVQKQEGKLKKVDIGKSRVNLYRSHITLQLKNSEGGDEDVFYVSGDEKGYRRHNLAVAISDTAKEQIISIVLGELRAFHKESMKNSRKRFKEELLGEDDDEPIEK
jgi:hypothetical protein